MRPHYQSFLGLIALGALAPLVGCASLADCKYETGQKIRAWHAYQDYRATCNPSLSSMDYACGWKSGFYDVATGGNGCPPLTAPAKYWKPNQILVRCDNDRKQWYVGFQDGAAYASQMPDTHYLKLWTPACQPCGCQTQGCPTAGCQTSGCQASGCHPPVCELPAEIISVDEGYSVGPELSGEFTPSPADEFSPESSTPPPPAELPAEEDVPVAPAEESAPAPVSPSPVSPPSADSGFQILGPLDVDLTDTRPAPFVLQSGVQIALVSGTETSSSSQFVLGGTH